MTLAPMMEAITRIARRLAGRAARPLSRVLAAAGLMVALNACAIPPIVSVAKLAADGVLYASTGKSSTDHGLSMATGKDCATLRVLDSQDVCQDVVVAEVEAEPVQIGRDRANLEALALTAPADTETHRAMADQALAAAFQPRAASTATSTSVAALPRPVDPGSVRVAVRAESKPPVVRVAAVSISPSRAVAARPGLIKVAAPPKRPMITKVALRDIATRAKSATRVEALSEPIPPPPERVGTMERFGQILKRALLLAHSDE